MHLEPRVLRAQPGRLHLLRRHRLGASSRELTGGHGLDPVALRLLDQSKFPGRNPDANLLRPLDGLFVELGRVLLLRYLLYFSSFRSRC